MSASHKARRAAEEPSRQLALHPAKNVPALRGLFVSNATFKEVNKMTVQTLPLPQGGSIASRARFWRTPSPGSARQDRLGQAAA